MLPRRPKRPCSYPGCSELTDGSMRSMQKKRTNATRSMTEIVLYAVGAEEFRNVSVTVMRRVILSANCVMKRVLVRTEEVHHKIPLSLGGTNERRNRIALCKLCHARIHAQCGGRWGNKKTTDIP